MYNVGFDGSYQISSVRSFDVPNRQNPITHVNCWRLGLWYKMQDLNLCKQFIQLLVSQYEPSLCDIIISCSVEYSHSNQLSSVPVIYLLLFWLHTCLSLTNDCMRGFAWTDAGDFCEGLRVSLLPDELWELLNVRTQIRSLMLWILEGFFVERFCNLQQSFTISLAWDYSSRWESA